MANVCKCDACGEIAEHKDSKRIRVLNKNDNGSVIAKTIHYVDVCPECYVKVKELLNLDGSE